MEYKFKGKHIKVVVDDVKPKFHAVMDKAFHRLDILMTKNTDLDGCRHDEVMGTAIQILDGTMHSMGLTPNDCQQHPVTNRIRKDLS